MTTRIALETTESVDRDAEPRIPGRGRGFDERGNRAERQRRAIGGVRASRLQLLSVGEECALAERIKAGDTAAQHQLILANMNLVLAIVPDYKNCGLPSDDLIQEGNLGLIRASQDFDPVAYGNRFRTYASFWIRTSIHRALAVNGSLIGCSEYVGLLRLRYGRAIRELEGQAEGVDDNGSDDLAQASLDEIAERMGVSLRQLKTARLPGSDLSHFVNAEAGAGNQRVAIEDLAVVRQPPESDLIDQENEELLHAALFRLNPFEAWVIRERYGFRQLRPELYGWAGTRAKEGGTSAEENPAPLSSVAVVPTLRERLGKAYYHRTYGEIGLDCGLSVHRVRLVEKAALDKLRRFLGQRLTVGSR